MEAKWGLSHFTPEENSDEHEGNAATWYSDWSKLTREQKSVGIRHFRLYWESCTSSQTKVYVTQEIDIIRSQQTAVKQNPFYTSIPGVLRDPQCEVRHHISLSVTPNNKVLTAKKSSQMAGLPLFSSFFPQWKKMYKHAFTPGSISLLLLYTYNIQMYRTSRKDSWLKNVHDR